MHLSWQTSLYLEDQISTNWWQQYINNRITTMLQHFYFLSSLLIIWKRNKPIFDTVHALMQNEVWHWSVVIAADLREKQTFLLMPYLSTKFHPMPLLQCYLYPFLDIDAFQYHHKHWLLDLLLIAAWIVISYLCHLKPEVFEAFFWKAVKMSICGHRTYPLSSTELAPDNLVAFLYRADIWLPPYNSLTFLGAGPSPCDHIDYGRLAISYSLLFYRAYRLQPQGFQP